MTDQSQSAGGAEERERNWKLITTLAKSDALAVLGLLSLEARPCPSHHRDRWFPGFGGGIMRCLKLPPYIGEIEKLRAGSLDPKVRETDQAGYRRELEQLEAKFLIVFGSRNKDEFHGLYKELIMNEVMGELRRTAINENLFASSVQWHEDKEHGDYIQAPGNIVSQTYDRVYKERNGGRPPGTSDVEWRYEQRVMRRRAHETSQGRLFE